MNGYFGLGMRWKLTELHFCSVMLGNAVLFITSRVSVDFHSCITSRDGFLMQNPQWFLYLTKEVMTEIVEKDSKEKSFLSSQQKFSKSQDANEGQRTACWEGTGGLVCLGRHCTGREVEWSCSHYFTLKTAAVTTHPLLEDQGASLLSSSSLQQTRGEKTASLMPFLILNIFGSRRSSCAQFCFFTFHWWARDARRSINSSSGR